MQLDEDVKSVVLRLLADLRTPRSLTIAILVRYGEWEQVANIAIDPSDYVDTVSGAAKFCRDTQATELLRKCSDLPGATGDVRMMNARESWLNSERTNCVTNARLTPWLNGYPAELEPAKAGLIWKVIQKARKEIRHVLGDIPDSLEIEGFSPGTYNGWKSEGRLPTAADKLASNITISPEALPIFRHAFPEAWERTFWELGSDFHLVDTENFGTVPKNAFVDRTIGTQPLGNMVLQLAVGNHIRQRLRKVAHIDLQYGQDLHSRTAWRASLSNEDATVDVRNASNSLARVLIRLLFGEDWYNLLNDLRVKFSVWTKDTRRIKMGQKKLRVKNRRYLEMFSAMGNGFTFEVETLVFWALARAVEIERPLVYGDDIIIPRDRLRDYVAVLRYFGFEPNPKKTFGDTAFRESCGGNYFAGYSVTPLRIQTFPRNPSEWIALHNGLWRASGCIGALATRRARLAALRYLPSDIRRLGGPTALGNLVLHGPDVFNRHAPRTIDGVTYWRVWKPVQHRYPFARYGGSALQTCMALIGIPSDGVGYRDNVTGYVLGWVPWS